VRIQYLKIFADLARYRNFSQTAQANNITQAAVSRVVGQLERRLGVLLVDRSTRPLQLTEPGKTFQEGCRNLVEEYKQLETAIGVSNARMSSRILVAAIYSVGLRDMSRYITLFEELNPGVQVQIEYLHPASVYDRILEGKADFGLVSYPRRSRTLAVLPWREEEMLLACSPGHDLARHRSIKPSQLDGQRYIGFTRELPIRQKVDRYLRQHGVTVDIILEFDNIECVKNALEIGSGVAILPEPMLRREVQSGTLVAVPLSGRRFVRPLSIVYRRNLRLSPAAASFVDLIRRPEKIRSGADLTPHLPLSHAIADNGSRRTASLSGNKRGAQ
jgi:DNA-binding transcriptional LysR family regulator